MFNLKKLVSVIFITIATTNLAHAQLYQYVSSAGDLQGTITFDTTTRTIKTLDLTSAPLLTFDGAFHTDVNELVFGGGVIRDENIGVQEVYDDFNPYAYYTFSQVYSYHSEGEYGYTAGDEFIPLGTKDEIRYLLLFISGGLGNSKEEAYESPLSVSWMYGNSLEIFYFGATEGVLQRDNRASGYASSFYRTNITTQPVPEPKTYSMLLAGLSLVGFVLRRKKV